MCGINRILVLSRVVLECHFKLSVWMEYCHSANCSCTRVGNGKWRSSLYLKFSLAPKHKYRQDECVIFPQNCIKFHGISNVHDLFVRKKKTLLLLSLHTSLAHHGIWDSDFRFRRALRLRGRYDALPSLCLKSRVLPRSLSFCPRSGEGSFCRPTLLPWCRSPRLRLTPAAFLSCRSCRGLLP